MTKQNKSEKRLSINEKIKLKREIDKIFSSKIFVYHFPIKLIIADSDNQSQQVNYKVIFIVPKRKIKKAVKRNLIRRRMKEAYRLNKSLLPNTNNKMLLAFVYIGTNASAYSEIEQKIILTLQKLNQNQTK